MADHRKPCAAYTLARPGRDPVRIEVFEAELWPQADGAGPGLYRVRRGRAWIMAPDKYTFITPAALGRLLAAELGEEPEAAPPDLSAGDRVRLREPGRMEPGSPVGWRYCRVLEDPIQEIDGRWTVLVHCWYGRKTMRVGAERVRRVK